MGTKPSHKTGGSWPDSHLFSNAPVCRGLLKTPNAGNPFILLTRQVRSQAPDL